MLFSAEGFEWPKIEWQLSEKMTCALNDNLVNTNALQIVENIQMLHCSLDSTLKNTWIFFQQVKMKQQLRMNQMKFVKNSLAMTHCHVPWKALMH